MINIVFSWLVFIVSLFFLRVIFSALATAALFFLFSLLLELISDSGRSFFLPFSKKLASLCLVSVLGLSFYALVFLPIEFWLTEIWKLTPRLPLGARLIFLAPLIIFLGRINWGRFLKTKLSQLVILAFVLVAGMFYAKYRQEKMAREYLPKIYAVTPSWGIQGSRVKIEGVNFFPAWKKGQAMLDDQEMLIESWGEKLVIAVLQVPAKFGPAKLYIKRNDNLVSNSFPFEIGDPETLKSL